MSFVKTLLNVHIVPHEQRALPHPILAVLARLGQQWLEHAQVINGNIEIGSPTGGPINLNGSWKTVVTPGVANTDFTVTHNLGRVAVDHNPRTKSAACDVYLSPTANPNPTTQIILRATTAGTTLTFFFT